MPLGGSIITTTAGQRSRFSLLCVVPNWGEDSNSHWRALDPVAVKPLHPFPIIQNKLTPAMSGLESSRTRSLHWCNLTNRIPLRCRTSSVDGGNATYWVPCGYFLISKKLSNFTLKFDQQFACTHDRVRGYIVHNRTNLPLREWYTCWFALTWLSLLCNFRDCGESQGPNQIK